MPEVKNKHWFSLTKRCRTLAKEWSISCEVLNEVVRDEDILQLPDAVAGVLNFVRERSPLLLHVSPAGGTGASRGRRRR